MTDDGTSTTSEQLAERLLRAPIAGDDRPGRRFAYPWWGMLIMSVLIGYHALILIVHNTPSKGLGRGLHRHVNDKLEAGDYMTAASLNQSWAMFAPNPHRSNTFMKVLIVDQAGETWDLKHDIHGVNRYPYLFYDRMGKINRRLIEETGYQKYYGAWVCREWERTHGGEPAKEVQFVKMWTKVPVPRDSIRTWGFDPLSLKLEQREAEKINCKTTPHAQVPNYLRDRYGLPPIEDGVFRGVHLRTWVDAKKSREQAEARKREQEAAQELQNEEPSEPEATPEPTPEPEGAQEPAEGGQ